MLPRDGRDELNLADFPISALPRAQKSDEQGRKLDRLEFTATRYDSATRQRVQQKVILTSTARDGLPTPADEHVILALLHVAKHTHDFADATVPFAPTQLFAIMGWAPNGRSYTRLRDVLRRLKSLTIRYDNAWWDVVGRGYEEEVATGIISSYRIARQVSGPRRPGQELLSWVTWTPQFHDSLRAGNLKRLNLEVFFQLSTPTAQRMYRFLDKRFYTAPTLNIDLVEFACGHLGLTDAGNVAVLKRRLAPALAELEQIGFLAPADLASRYQKVKVGQWRIVLQAAGRPVVPEVTGEPVPSPAPAVSPPPLSPAPADELAREFYRRWNPAAATLPGPRDREQAEQILRDRGLDEARGLLPWLVQVTRAEWPECRSFSGAVQKYLADAVRLYEQHTRRADARRRADEQRDQQRDQAAQETTAGRTLQQSWDALSVDERQAIEQQVRDRLGGHAPAAFVHRLCLEALARRLSAPPD